MSPDLPVEPSDEPAVERLAAYLDLAAQQAGGQGGLGPLAGTDGPDDHAAAVVAQLRADSTWTPPPAHLRTSILESVLAQSAGQDQGSAEDDAAQAEVRPLVPRWRRLRWAVPAAAAATVVFTLAVLGGQQLASAPDDGTSYAVSGTAYAPTAGGTVALSAAPAGFAVVLDTHDLPAAPPDYYYSAWLRGSTQSVPLGSFHGRQTGEPIRLWSGVDPRDYPNFTVTLQAEGQSPAPSGRVVLTGTLTG